MKKKNPPRAVAFCGTLTPYRRALYLDAEVEEWLERKWGEMSPDRQAIALHISRVNERRRAAKSPTLSTRLPTYLKRISEVER